METKFYEKGMKRRGKCALLIPASTREIREKQLIFHFFFPRWYDFGIRISGLKSKLAPGGGLSQLIGSRNRLAADFFLTLPQWQQSHVETNAISKLTTRLAARPPRPGKVPKVARET